MAHNISKSKKAQLRKQRANKKIKKMESQDRRGISRKPLKNAIDPKIFVVLKIIAIISIPVCYLIYSPLLIVCVIFNILMFIFAIMAENHINHTFIKSNHIKFLKFDSVIAVIVLIVTIASFAMSLETKRHMPFGDSKMRIVMQLENLGSCQTGGRSLLRLGGFGKKFGPVDFPKDMPQLPPEGFDFGTPPEGFPGKFEIKLEDLPLEAVFSQMLSSINTVLLFLIPVAGAGSLIHYYYRKKRFDKEMNEIITDELPNLDEFNLDEIFMFGYIE